MVSYISNIGLKENLEDAKVIIAIMNWNMKLAPSDADDLVASLSATVCVGEHRTVHCRWESKRSP